MLIIRNTKGEKMIDLAINDLENVVGGGNALSCATGIGTGYSCGAWYHTGD